MAPVDFTWLKVGYEGYWASGTEDRTGSGAIAVKDKRRLDELVGGIYLKVGELVEIVPRELAVDMGARYPLSGQNIPRGPTYSIGLGYGFSVK